MNRPLQNLLRILIEVSSIKLTLNNQLLRIMFYKVICYYLLHFNFKLVLSNH